MPSKQSVLFVTVNLEQKKAEGKHGWTIMNAIKNKLIHRVFACVREQRIYRKEL